MTLPGITQKKPVSQTLKVVIYRCHYCVDEWGESVLAIGLKSVKNHKTSCCYLFSSLGIALNQAARH